MKFLRIILTFVVLISPIIGQTALKPVEYFRIKPSSLLPLEDITTRQNQIITRKQALNFNYVVNSNKEFYVSSKGLVVFPNDIKPLTIIHYNQKEFHTYSNLLAEYFNYDSDKVVGTSMKLDLRDNLVLLINYVHTDNKIFHIEPTEFNIIEIGLERKINSKKFFINFSNELLFYTFSVNDLVDGRSIENGNIFVFDEKGKYKRRSKFYIQDVKGDYYKGFLSADNNVIIKEYLNNNSKNKDENQLINVREITISPIENSHRNNELNDEFSWVYIGIDSTSNIYYANNSTIAKLNFTNNNIEYLDYTTIFKNNYYATHKQIEINNHGDIFIMALTSSSQNVIQNQFVDPHEVELVFFELKYK